MHYIGNATHTSPQNYKDLDGNMRTFSMVDHDKKTKISVPSAGQIDYAEEKKKYRSHLVEKILSIEAVHCPIMFKEFTKTVPNEQGFGKILWNDVMLNDAGLPLQRLEDLYVLTSNSAYYYEHRIAP